jgi:heme/copper-type cytochrome/quinol oxidase subunit 3
VEWEDSDNSDDSEDSDDSDDDDWMWGVWVFIITQSMFYAFMPGR